MNRAWLFCHRELGAQRGALLGYAALACVTMMGLFHLVGPRMLSTVEDAGYVVGWFVLVMVLGATVVLAPGAVRLEHEGRDDQFVRRLPGALGPAFAGKLMFLLASAAVLGGVGFAVSHLMVWTGELRLENVSLLRELYAAPRHLLTPLLGYAGLALCAVPWVFAVASWLPRGRYSVGVVGVLVIGGALLANAIRGEDLAMRAYAPLLPWLGWITPCGVFVAWLSLVRGRRGGGLRRSLVFGGAATLCTLVPPGINLMSAARLYYRPEVAELTEAHAIGVEPSGRFALIGGHALGDFAYRAYGVGPQEGPRWRAFRVDLETGAAERLDGVNPNFANYSDRLCLAEGGFYDMTTGERIAGQWGDFNAIRRERGGRQRIAQLGDTEVFLDGDKIEFGDGDSTETLSTGAGMHAWCCGDGFVYHTREGCAHLDFATRKRVKLPKSTWGFAAVQGIWVCSEANAWHKTFRFSAITGERLPCAVNGFTADHLGGGKLLVQGLSRRLAIYDPIEDRVTDLPGQESEGLVLGITRRGPVLSDHWNGVAKRSDGSHRLIRIHRTTFEVTSHELGSFWPTSEVLGDWLIGQRDGGPLLEMLNWRTGERRRLLPHVGGAR